jgi:hypothetical protein
MIGGKLRFEEKMDGVKTFKNLVGNDGIERRAFGETMPDGRFFLIDVVQPGRLTERMDVIDRVFPTALRPATGQDGSFMEEVLSRGGEGIVIKPLNSRWGDFWAKCKRQITIDLTVSETCFDTGSIRLTDGRNDLGWCPAKKSFDSICVGDMVEIVAFGFHKSGKLREARFIRSRPDKTSVLI